MLSQVIKKKIKKPEIEIEIENEGEEKEMSEECDMEEEDDMEEEASSKPAKQLKGLNSETILAIESLLEASKKKPKKA